MAHALHSGAIGHHDPLNRHRDALPSISHLDLDKLKTGRNDASKYSSMHGLNISTAPLGSPNTIYSGPPPPYSSASSTIGSAHGLSGYISTPDSATRRLLREEKESPYDGKSLPSIHEALGNKSISYPAPPSAVAQHPSTSTPSTAVSQSFPDVARGPGNPFSHPNSTLREKSYTSLPQTNAPPTSDPHQHKGSFSASEPRSSISQPFGYPNSPPSNNHIDFRGSTSSHTSLHNHNEAPLLRSPRFTEPSRPAPSFSQYNNQPPSNLNSTSQSFQFTALPKIEDQRPPFPRNQDQPYGDTVKRHLDVYDAEVSLNEIAEITSRTAEFARVWLERRHSDNRTSLSAEHLPSIQEVDDMMRQSHRMVENFNRIRDVIIAQETAMSEHRARMARGNIEDEYGGVSDEYKGGGFAGGDAKKRRGKAAPPGRCHSCNRAETPEWRRGPDGARTLCNACGLHYAKLTRKMGVNKAATMTGSNLRPKTIDPRN